MFVLFLEKSNANKEKASKDAQGATWNKDEVEEVSKEVHEKVEDLMPKVIEPSGEIGSTKNFTTTRTNENVKDSSAEVIPQAEENSKTSNDVLEKEQVTMTSSARKASDLPSASGERPRKPIFSLSNESPKKVIEPESQDMCFFDTEVTRTSSESNESTDFEVTDIKDEQTVVLLRNLGEPVTEDEAAAIQAVIVQSKDNIERIEKVYNEVTVENTAVADIKNDVENQTSSKETDTNNENGMASEGEPLDQAPVERDSAPLNEELHASQFDSSDVSTQEEDSEATIEVAYVHEMVSSLIPCV